MTPSRFMILAVLFTVPTPVRSGKMHSQSSRWIVDQNRPYLHSAETSFHQGQRQRVQRVHQRTGAIAQKSAQESRLVQTRQFADIRRISNYKVTGPYGLGSASPID